MGLIDALEKEMAVSAQEPDVNQKERTSTPNGELLKGVSEGWPEGFNNLKNRGIHIY